MELQNNIDLRDAVEQFLPRAVLVLYEKAGESKHYMEKSDIVNGKLLGYHPVSADDIKSVLGSIQAAEHGLIQCSGIMPRCLLYLDIVMGDFTVVWWRPASIKKLQFEKEMKVKAIITKVPAMIYYATRTNLKVYALKKNRLPVMTTEIYKAPYLNVYEDGRVCLGNTKIDIPQMTTIEHIIAEYEKAFWFSEFTNSGSSDTLNLWKEISKNETKSFPVSVLKKHQKFRTLKNIIDGKTK